MSDYLFEMPIHSTSKADNTNSFGRKSIRFANRNQIEFKISYLDELLPQEHRARDVWEYVSQLDSTTFHDEIKVVEGSGGPRTADPKILLGLWLFGMLEGISSARHIARLCQEHHAYIWLCGGVTINYHSLSDFRTKNHDGFLKLLQESIAIMWKSGVFAPDEVAQDGTRVKANAGFSQYRTEKTLDQYLEQAKEHIAKMEIELSKDPSFLSRREKSAKERAIKERAARIKKAKEELIAHKAERIAISKKNHNKLTQEEIDKMRCSVTDPECRKMKMGDGGFRLAYNVQFTTSTNKNVILGVDVVNTLDPGTLVPMMRQVLKNLSSFDCPPPSRWLVDSAYANNEDLETAKKNFPNSTIYSSPTSTQKGVDPLEPRKNDKPAMVELRVRMQSNEAKEIYSKRGAAAEHSNATAKNMGMREFLVRGLSKVKQMALLYALAHNMMVYFRTM
jgi:transposase